MKNAYDYLVKNDIISKNMKGEISIKCYALDGREIYNGLTDNAIKKLKGFIDREELKDKINNEFELHRTIFKCKAIFTEKGFNNLKKKILELLK